MDMQININLIKSQRQQRAWSQTQLAEVSGLSLRTIQRIEKTGTASLESAKSIAAVFEIDVQQLQHQPASPVKSFNAKLTVLFSAVFISLSSLFGFTANAKPVMVDLILSSNGENIADTHLLIEENTQSEMLISGKLKVLVTTVIEDNNLVSISTKIYDLSSGQQTSIATPTLVTKHQQKAEIHFGDYALSLTPNI